MMRRWSHILLFVYPLVALGVIMWVMRDATALLDSTLEGTQP